MTTAEIEKLKNAKTKHPDAGRHVLMKLTGLSDNKCQRFLKGDNKPTAANAVKPAGVPTATGTTKTGRTLTEFRAAYDKDTIVPGKIRQALKELGAGGWEYEAAFVKLAGLTHADLGNYRDQFVDFVVVMKDRRAWAGSAKTATIMREML